jgi:hypothetical protein
LPTFNRQASLVGIIDPQRLISAVGWRRDLRGGLCNQIPTNYRISAQILTLIKAILILPVQWVLIANIGLLKSDGSLILR